MVNKYVIWGSSGHAKVLADLIDEQKNKVIALFDNSPTATPAVKGVDLWCGEEGFEAWKKIQSSTRDIRGVVAIGGSRGEDRQLIYNRLRDAGLQIPNIIHGKAYVSPSATLGVGIQILANSTVASDVRIDGYCIINHNASVDHECILGNGVHIAPGATICGCVHIDDYSMIGAGAIVLPRLSIGRKAIIGAGAVVTKSIPPGAIVLGNPARLKK
jgi:sugar O-acyltransferase (sialic acid O-acetyltransferase NeuD family)